MSNTLPVKSRLNAVTHGIYATDSIFIASLKPRDRSIFEVIRDATHTFYKPQTDEEKEIVDQMAIQRFRLYRLYAFENIAADGSKSFPLAKESIIHHLDRFSRYDWRINREIRVLHNHLFSLYRKRGDPSLNFFSARD